MLISYSPEQAAGDAGAPGPKLQMSGIVIPTDLAIGAGGRDKGRQAARVRITV
jgi:hypothetical protein